MARCRFKELWPSHAEQGIALDDEGVGMFLRHRGHHLRYPLGRAHFEQEELDADRERPRLCFTTHRGRGWVRWIDEKRDASRCRERLGQNLEPLAAQLRVHDREPSDVRPGPGEGGDEASAHRVRAHRDDGDRPGCLHCGAGRGSVTGEDDLDRNANQLCGEMREFLVIGTHAPLEPDVLALDPAEVAETILE